MQQLRRCISISELQEQSHQQHLSLPGSVAASVNETWFSPEITGLTDLIGLTGLGPLDWTGWSTSLKGKTQQDEKKTPQTLSISFPADKTREMKKLVNNTGCWK